MQRVVIEAQPRTQTGKKANAELRKAGMVPCVLYGGTDNVNFAAPTLAFRPIIFTPQFRTADIQVNGKTYWAFVKSIQSDPVTDAITHIDFQQLVPEKKVICDIPVHTEGTSKGVIAGGVLVLKVKKLKLKGLPKDIPYEVKVNVSDLEIGKSFRVRDLNIPDVEIINSGNIPMVSIEIPRAYKEEATAAAAPAADAKAAAPAADAKAAEAKPAAKK